MAHTRGSEVGFGPRPLGHAAGLDGLRAVAVVAVVVFHWNERLLPGGFLGVDLFFVLSGYLITRLLIVEHHDSGRVALGGFYARRLRRLLPATLAVVAAVIAWGAVAATPTRLQPLRGDVFATLTYVANWRFIAVDEDYFGAASGASPLRHVWSLAVEEQFYVVWPLLLLGLLTLLRRAGSTRAPVLVAVCLVGATMSATVMALVFDPGSPTRAYFGTDARVHQMLIGAAAGIAHAALGRHGLPPARRHPATVWVPLAVLGAAMVGVSGETVAYYRGGSLLIAVIVAVLIVGVVEERSPVVGRALTLAPVQYVGRISYGVYLWHWPVFLWWTASPDAGFLERRLVDLGRFGLTFALAAASFHTFENAIRRGRAPWIGSRGGRTTVAAMLASGMLAGVAAVMLVPGDDAASVAATDQSVTYCPDQPRPCVRHDAGPGAPVVVSFGDSTSQALSPGLIRAAEDRGFTYVQAGLGGCGADGRHLAKGRDGARFTSTDDRCRSSFPSILDEVVTLEPDLVILADRQVRFAHEGGDGELVKPWTKRHSADVIAGFDATIGRLEDAGATVVVIAPLPTLPTADCLAEHLEDPEACATAARERRSDAARNLVEAAASRHPDVVLVDLEEVVCDEDTCPPFLDSGEVVSYDGVHLTGRASRALGPILMNRIEAAGVRLQ